MPVSASAPAASGVVRALVFPTDALRRALAEVVSNDVLARKE